MKAYYWVKKEKGECYRCSQKAAPNCTLCPKHLLATRERERRKYRQSRGIPLDRELSQTQGRPRKLIAG